MIFITGKEGFLASKLAFAFRDNVVLTSLNEGDEYYLNLENASDFDYSRLNAKDIVYHLAGISSPDVCENNYDKIRKINVDGTIYFLNACLERGARVVFFSSDTVYGDGEHEYNENSMCKPIGNYAGMKYAVEKHFKGNSRLKIFRLSYIFSREDKYTAYLLACHKNGSEAEVFHPFMRNVVYLKDLLDACANIDAKWDSFGSQVVNICGPQICSRVEIAKMLKNNIGNSFKYRIVYPGDAFYKARPKIINVSSLYLKILLGRKEYAIEDAMKIELQEMSL